LFDKMLKESCPYH
jgi:hypothetical protein